MKKMNLAEINTKKDDSKKTWCSSCGMWITYKVNGRYSAQADYHKEHNHHVLPCNDLEQE